MAIASISIGVHPYTCCYLSTNFCVARCCHELFLAFYCPASRLVRYYHGKKEIGFRLDSVVDVSYFTNVRRQELFHYFLSLLVFLRPFWAIGEFLEVHSSAFRSGGRWVSLPIRRLQNMECRTFLSESLGCGNTRLLVSYAHDFELRSVPHPPAIIIIFSCTGRRLICCGAKSAARNRGQHGPNMDQHPLRGFFLFCARNLRTYVV